VRADGSRKPSYDALQALIKGEWWLRPTDVRTDDAGRLGVRGFFGDYQISVDGKSAAFAVASDEPTVSVTVDA